MNEKCIYIVLLNLETIYKKIFQYLVNFLSAMWRFINHHCHIWCTNIMGNHIATRSIYFGKIQSVIRTIYMGPFKYYTSHFSSILDSPLLTRNPMQCKQLADPPNHHNGEIFSIRHILPHGQCLPANSLNYYYTNYYYRHGLILGLLRRQ